MFMGGIPIDIDMLPESFAKFCDKKVNDIVGSTLLNASTYNGKKIVNFSNKMFMDQASIRVCMLSLKIKNIEGFDRIPKGILLDGLDCQISLFVWTLP